MLNIAFCLCDFSSRSHLNDLHGEECHPHKQKQQHLFPENIIFDWNLKVSVRIILIIFAIETVVSV